MKNTTPLLHRPQFRNLKPLASLIAGLSAVTAFADIVGPDGLTYPDWTKAGIAGGIPAVTSPLVDLSAYGSDSADDSAAIEAAAASLTSGGVVYLGAGTYYLDRPVVIENSGVVLRGAGEGSTKIVFRWAGPTSAPEFTRPASGSTVYRNTYIQAFANPDDLKKLTIKVDGTTVQSVSRSSNSEVPICSISTSGQKVISKAGAGSVTLSVEAQYFSSATQTSSMTVTLDSSTVSDPWRIPNEVGGVGLIGAISFLGGQPTFNNTIYSQKNLTATAARGDDEIVLSSGHGFSVGDKLEIQAPPTSRWNAETGNPITFGVHRANQYEVTGVSGNTLTVDGNFRVEFTLADVPYVRKLAPIERCGVEDLTLEQTTDLWICGFLFSNAWECWAQNVTVRKAGRHPLYMVSSKYGEIRDCTMIDGVWKGHGGSAYVGWDQSYDCLMEDVSTAFLRHAPIVQWGASGNVIRNSTFYGSDAQFHAGYANENLFENCVVLSNVGDGSYGGAVYSANDTSHGINGPRNVVYNCDFSAPNDGYYNGGVWLGGGNNDWKILHNRFLLENEGAIYLKEASTDHLFGDNVWVLRSPSSGIQIDNTGSDDISVVDNDFIGITAAQFSGGAMAPDATSGNSFTDMLDSLSLSNGSFESGITGWVQAEASFSAVVSGSAKDGTYRLRLTDTSVGSGSAYSSRLESGSYSVNPGETCQLQFWTKFVAGDDTGAVVQLQFLNSSNNVLRNVSTQIKDYWTEWRLVSITGDAPAGTASCRIAVRSYDDKEATVDFDGFRLGVLPVGIANPGFEGQLDFWDDTGDNGLSVADTNAAFNGSYGVRVTDNSASLNSSLKSEEVPATAGKTYQVRFRARVNSGEGVRVWLRFSNASGSIIDEQSYTLPSAADAADWRQYVLQAIAPASTAFVRVRIRSFATSGLEADFDDFVLMEAPDRPTPSTPSIFAWQRL
ncbi:MAG: carbohydrate binding domain-containing protein [Verrucomicrobiota bacterium JB022]|nr:carbohydrate binding domain-containing protein [Verrucomicrobiota bacterium JB022]